MADEKEPMDPIEQENAGRGLANEDEPPSAGRPAIGRNEGQSGGGHYPNPHDDPDNADPEGGFMGHGGESDMRYYGDGQLGSKKVGERHNATTEDER